MLIILLLLTKNVCQKDEANLLHAFKKIYHFKIKQTKISVVSQTNELEIVLIWFQLYKNPMCDGRCLNKKKIIKL